MSVRDLIAGITISAKENVSKELMTATLAA
jgi:hypothetical protein